MSGSSVTVALCVLLIGVLGGEGVRPVLSTTVADSPPAVTGQPAKQRVTPARLERAIQRYLSTRFPRVALEGPEPPSYRISTFPLSLQ
ncbi:MAG: hypothetical protein HY581_07315 [Nitrospirae bacterium]|nr:hypothetical protein [Nitrospirota bacterium]